MVGDNDDEPIKKICDLIRPFEKAEEAIKSAELAAGDLVLTPINQLRYGFKHLTQALKSHQSGNNVDFDLNISKALGHCKRSYYDARDVEIVFHLERFQEFFSTAHKKGVVLSNLLPEYRSWVSTAAEAQKFLAAAPSIIENKDERYDVITDFLFRMKEISNALPGALEIVNENISQQKKLQDEANRLRAEADEARNVAKSTLTFSKGAFWATLVFIAVAFIVVIFDEHLKDFGRRFSTSPKSAQVK